MARLLVLVLLAFGLGLIVLFAVSAISGAARGGRDVGHSLARGTTMQKISYAALLVLMLGVTAGRLGGL